MLYEPSPLTVFNGWSRSTPSEWFFQPWWQSFASETVRAMNAMNGATKNADEMIEKLSHQYNTVRQLAITNEIAEITAGAAGARRLTEMRKAK
jgi:F-type H+-transporting ATPase subunit gamma